jgi:uncharacterized protein YjlB
MSVWRRMMEGCETAEPRTRGETAVEELPLGRIGFAPNNPRLPVLLQRGALAGESVDRIKGLFEANRWFRVWDWTILDFHHFHSNAHEVLTVAAGKAEIRLGGTQGATVALETGDTAILPAGVVHCRMVSSSDFRVVGAYPEGQEDRNLLEVSPRHWPGVEAEIAAVPLPATDPVYGADGPLMERWGAG